MHPRAGADACSMNEQERVRRRRGIDSQIRNSDAIGFQIATDDDRGHGRRWGCRNDATPTAAWPENLAEREALAGLAEHHAVLADLLDLHAAVHRLALAVAAAVDEDEALRRDVGVREDLQLEALAVGLRRRGGRG